MNGIPSLARKVIFAAAIAAMLPAGAACAAPNAVQDAAVESKISDQAADEFIGFWEKEDNDRVGLTITPAEKGWYGIEISWPRNKKQVDMWTMTAKPAGNHVLQYTDCKHYLLTYGEKYIEKEELLYQDGTGSLKMVGTKRITWQDDQDHKADGTAFVPLTSPLGGGL
jgi:hypothetical protein